MGHRSMIGLALLAIGLVAVSARGQGEASAKDKWTKAERDKGYVVFAYSTMKNLPAGHVPRRESTVNRLTCVLATDEYESLQFGVHAIADDVEAISVNVESDLDVTVYHRILPAVKEQLALEPMDSGEVSGWIPSKILLQRGNVFPVLGAGQSVNFWLTFHADRDTKPGRHLGKVRIRTAGKSPTFVDLAITVRPFALQRPRIPYGMWCREDMLPKRFGGVSTSRETMLKIYRDMAVHGQNAGAFYPAGNFFPVAPENDHVLHKLLPLAKEAGLVDPQVSSTLIGGITGGYTREQVEEAASWLQAECREKGWPELVGFGPDEPDYPEEDIEVREACESMRGTSFRMNLDQSELSAVYGYSTYGLYDIQTVAEGVVTPEVMAEAKRLGTEMQVYSYTIWRDGFYPVRQRYFAGLHTWSMGLRGNWIWAYNHGKHRHAWFAPGSDEPQPVTGWEMRREGVDDYRYLQMLQDAVEANHEKPLAREAKSWLAGLRARLGKITQPLDVVAGKPLALAEYDEIRARAASYIQRLGPIPPAAMAPQPRRRPTDEAAPFRGKSVTACIKGLRDADASQRRAAAWALFDMGPKAAAATATLAQLLDDDDVRMPALHALEAIGPQAYPAVPQIARLLKHPDSYFRMGAVLTLARIGCPLDKRVKSGRRSPSAQAATVAGPLAGALLDEHPVVARKVATIISALGPAAKLAIPTVITMLESSNRATRASGVALITGLGQDAAGAAATLAELHAKSPGNSAVIKALAAIGPAAEMAIPALEKYAAKDDPGNEQAESYYALTCIRGGTADLWKMVNLLKNPRVTVVTKNYVVTLFDELGPRAAPVGDAVRSLTKDGKFTNTKRVSGFGKTSPAEAHYVDGADCRNLVPRLRVLARLPIDGWRFKDDPRGVGVEEGYFRPDFPSANLSEIKIAEFWDEQGFKDLREGWYRLRYKCPDLPDGKRLFLHFGAVDESAWLYVDGKLVAWYDTADPDETWSKPFLLDVSGSLKSQGEYLLAIKVHNYSGSGGLYKPVSLMVEK